MATLAHAQSLLDPTLTPGAINPNVTQNNIHQTICVSGWVKTISPPTNYTNQLKLTQLKEYGYTDLNPDHYEEDHLISLELGGSPKDPKNLWPEPLAGEWGAHAKDKVENKLKKMVCAEKITLKEAQNAITVNWIDAYKKYALIKTNHNDHRLKYHILEGK